MIIDRELTFLVAADHGVTVEAREVSLATEAKVVLGPLNGALLVEYPAGQRDLAADHGRLVHRLDGKALVDHLRGGPWVVGREVVVLLRSRLPRAPALRDQREQQQ